MAIYDEIHEQHKKLGDMTLRQKISYIIYYYKYVILGTAVALLFIISLIRSIASQKDSALYCAMVNSLPYDSGFTTLTEDFSSFAGIDLDEYDVTIDCSMNMNYEQQDQMTYGYAQKIMALLNTGDIDVFIADKPVIDNYGQVSAFVDLTEILPEDLQQELEGTFDYYYYDFTDEDTGVVSTIPIGIYIYDSKLLQNCYDKDGVQGMYAEVTDPIFCITSTSHNQENAIQFLRFLISDN